MKRIHQIGRGGLVIGLALVVSMSAGMVGGCAESGWTSGRSASMAELWSMRTGERLEAGGATKAGRQLRSARRRAQDVRNLEMFDGTTGERVGWQELVHRAAGADVVVIGEMHGHKTGLTAAAELFDGIVASGQHAALSMEFFERDEQAAIDDYLMGITDEDAFKKAAGKTGGNYPEGHRRMVERAKRDGLSVIASNAPRRYVRYGRREGKESLGGMTGEQRRLMDVPSAVTRGQYQEEFLGMFGFNPDGTLVKSEEEESEEGGDGDGGGGHGMEITFEDAEGYFFAQNIWDETMARSVVESLEGGSRPVVQVVGRFHSDFGGGLVERVRMLSPDARVFVISMVEEEDVGGEIREDDKSRADVVIYVGDE